MTSNWYVLRQEQQTGPFSFYEMVAMLQKKMLRTHDYVWTPGIQTWSPLSQMRDFRPEYIQYIYGLRKDLFKERRCPRVKINLPMWVHDNKEIWPAKITSLSLKGAGIKIASPTLVSGSIVQFHFRKHGEIVAFNCKARILSKTHRPDINKFDSIVDYTAYFESIPAAGLNQIESIVLGKGI